MALERSVCYRIVSSIMCSDLKPFYFGPRSIVPVEMVEQVSQIIADNKTSISTDS